MSSDVEDLSPRSRTQYINNKSNETNFKDSSSENKKWDIQNSSDLSNLYAKRICT